MQRRQFLLASALAALGLPAAAVPANPALSKDDDSPPDTPPDPRDGRIGHLFIIGGAEDRRNDKVLLRRFVELTGVPDPRIIVLTAASAYHDEMWDIYDRAFGDLGVERRSRLELGSREDADSQALAETVATADGIFMTGGDQRRLMSVIGGTRTAQAMDTAFRKNGACIGGTSAGAAVMSQHMVAEGRSAGLPAKGAAHMGAGLGFLRAAIVDQHFSQRQRFGRLLSMIAQSPYLLGVGIDEDTALIIARGRGLEVMGRGAVTIVDGRSMASNFFDIGSTELLEMMNVKLHLLPGGARYYLPEQGQVDDRDRGRQPAPSGAVPKSLQDVVDMLTDI